MFNGVALAMIRWYKRNISPSLPAGCRYQPTCSEYSHEAIEVHGVVKGIGLTVWRLMRCNPWSKGGIDRVPGTDDKPTNQQTSEPVAAGRHGSKGA